MPKPHVQCLDELARLASCNRSEIVRRLIQQVLDGAIPPEALTTSVQIRTRYRKRTAYDELMELLSQDASPPAELDPAQSDEPSSASSPSPGSDPQPPL